MPAGEYKVFVLVKSLNKKLYGDVQKWKINPPFRERLALIKGLPLPAKALQILKPSFQSKGKEISFIGFENTHSKKRSAGKGKFNYNLKGYVGIKQGKNVQLQPLPKSAKISFVLIGKSNKVLLYKKFNAVDFMKKGYPGSCAAGNYRELIWADINSRTRIGNVISFTR